MAFKIFLTILLLVSFPAHAKDSFICEHIAEENGRQIVHPENKLSFSLQNENVNATIDLPQSEASKSLTFQKCGKTKQDHSDFSRWFEIECRQLSSLDGSEFTIKKYLRGIYAGISPPVTPAYSMWKELSIVSKEVGRLPPDRTFVIYSLDGSPIYEFFCHSESGI